MHVVVLVALCLSSVCHTQKDRQDIRYTLGIVTACSEQDSGLTLALRTGDGDIAIAARTDDAPDHFGDAQRLAGTTYLVDGGCPALGMHTRVTRYMSGAASVLVSIEVGPTSQNPAEQLWLVRQWFDLQVGRAFETQALFAASMVMSQHNARDGGNRALWVKARYYEAWPYLETVERARVALEQYGRPSLAEAVMDGVKLYKELRNEIVVVRGVPFMPRDPGAPFVGWWGTFPIELYQEAPRGGWVRRMSSPATFW